MFEAIVTTNPVSDLIRNRLAATMAAWMSPDVTNEHGEKNIDPRNRRYHYALEGPRESGGVYAPTKSGRAKFMRDLRAAGGFVVDGFACHAVNRSRSLGFSFMFEPGTTGDA